jgi:hypothetical protein
MRLAGLVAIYQRPDTSKPAAAALDRHGEFGQCIWSRSAPPTIFSGEQIEDHSQAEQSTRPDGAARP